MERNKGSSLEKVDEVFVENPFFKLTDWAMENSHYALGSLAVVGIAAYVATNHLIHSLVNPIYEAFKGGF